MLKTLKNIAADKAGATGVEYAIIAAVVSIAALGAFVSVGEQSNENMTEVADKYATAQAQ